jgi:hypothetical protein
MRKFALAMLATVSALTAVPAMADSAYPYQTQQSRNWDRDNDGRNDRLEDRAYDQRFDRDRDGRPDRLEDRAFDRRFDGSDRRGYSHGYGYGAPSRQYVDWYPGWRHSWYENREILPPHRLIRRVERQGFFGARPMGFSRRGMIRVMAFDQWRRPVSLRVDPYTGAVLRVRPA